MHPSGKVLAWIAVLGAGLAIWWSAKYLHMRNAWMDLAIRNETKFKDNEAAIAKKTLELDRRKTELARDMLGWDRYWPLIGARFDRDGKLSLAMGTANGAEVGAVVYAFAVNPDGTSKYLGDYKLIRADLNASQAQPNWRVRPGEVTPNSAPFEVRLRSMIPNQYQARLSTLDQHMLALEERVATEKDQLARQKQLAEMGANQIALRLGQIEGHESLKDKALPDEIAKGYLQAIRDADEARNAALLESDRLLRELKKTRRAFEETLRANRRMTETLPQGTPGDRTAGALGR